jgi:DNA primase
MLPSSVIKEYLYAKFSVNKVFGEEFTTNSFFVDDDKMKLSINMESGLWQDFRAHENGNFPQLVAAVEGIPYDEALRFLRSKLFDSPEHLFEVSSLRVSLQTPTQHNAVSDIFSSFKKFDLANADPTSMTDRLAKKFILSRKLHKFDFYISKSGRYHNRLIIPYAYDNQEPFYFQARNLSLLGVKYLNPSREVTGVKSSDILFPYKESSDYIFMTEGPLDAISLQLNGLNATCTQGSNLSRAQAEQLKDKQIIFAYDNDEAGREGVTQARNMMLSKNKNHFMIAKLPAGIKDWNELHVKCQKSADFKASITDGLREVDFSYEVTEALD